MSCSTSSITTSAAHAVPIVHAREVENMSPNVPVRDAEKFTFDIARSTPPQLFQLLMRMEEEAFPLFQKKLQLDEAVKKQLKSDEVREAKTVLEQYQRAFFLACFTPVTLKNLTQLTDLLPDTLSQPFSYFILDVVKREAFSSQDKTVAQVLSLWKSIIYQAIEKEKPAIRKGLHAVLIVTKTAQVALNQFRIIYASIGSVIVIDSTALEIGTYKKFSMAFDFTLPTVVNLIAATQFDKKIYQGFSDSAIQNLRDQFLFFIQGPHLIQSEASIIGYHQKESSDLITFSTCYRTDLFKALDKHSVFKDSPLSNPEDFIQALIISRDVLVALEYMHQNRKIHWDIKLENVFLSSEFQVFRAYLSDFNFVQDITEEGNRRNFDTLFPCASYGAQEYTSPELLQVMKQLSKSSPTPVPMIKPPGGFYAQDIWAFGILLGNLFTSLHLGIKHIRNEKQHRSMLKRVGKEFQQAKEATGIKSCGFFPFLKRCFGIFNALVSFDAAKRMPISQALRFINELLVTAYKQWPSESGKRRFQKAVAEIGP